MMDKPRPSLRYPDDPDDRPGYNGNPLTEAQVDEWWQWCLDGHDVACGTLREALATIQAKDEEIAAVTAKRDHYKAAFEQTTSPSISCAEERATGAVGCGTCALCFNEMKSERDAKDEEIAKLRREVEMHNIPWVDFGDISRGRLDAQNQYISRYVDGSFDYPVCGEGLRFRKKGGGLVDTNDYHFIEIHREDVEEFIRRVVEAKGTDPSFVRSSMPSNPRKTTRSEPDAPPWLKR